MILNMPGKTLLEKVHESLKLAVNHSLDEGTEDGYWSGEVYSNTTITAEYIFLRQQFGMKFDPTETEALIQWLFSKQKNDGSWGIDSNCPGNVSTTTETYLALKILGISPEDPRMQGARVCISNFGGLVGARMFTRIFLASFGLISWRSVPSLPVELILLPKQSPINIYNLAQWARAVCVPLTLVRHHEPVYALPNGLSANNDFLDELWTDQSTRVLSYAPPLSTLWRRREFADLFFTAADSAISVLGRYFKSPLQSLSRHKIVDWIFDHQETSGDWAATWPALQNSLLALSLEGFTLDHPVMKRGFAATRTFVRHDALGMRAEITSSELWDTALMTIALSHSASSTGRICPRRTIDWLLDHEVSSHHGDWRISRPNLSPGGFCFQMHNTLSPDIDDSTVTTIALIKATPAHLTYGCVFRAVHWVLGMQNSDGGWGTYEWNNNKFFLNRLPFSDMESLCDPSTPDVTGGALECFGVMLFAYNGDYLDDLLAARLRDSCCRAIDYLLATQNTDGTWYGRWGVNYIYGTSNVLRGLSHFHTGEDRNGLQNAVDRAVRWLKDHQNPDGGWGETTQSYTDVKQSGCGPSSPTQSAWAILALLSYLPPDDESVQKGVSYLVDSQVKDSKGDKATWPLVHYTATGFMGHLYLEYDYYRHYFPIMALGRYTEKCLRVEHSDQRDV